MRDLERLMKGVIGWQYAVHSLFGAADREVAVQLDHCDAARDCFDSIYLDLVVVLGRDTRDRQRKEYDRG